MKVIIAAVLMLFAVLSSSIEAAETQKLVFLNQSGYRALARVDLGDSGGKPTHWEHMFANRKQDATAVLPTGCIYPVQIFIWKADEKIGSDFSYQARPGVATDTLVITRQGTLVRLDKKNGEALGLVATPPDSLVPTVLTSPRLPEKAKQDSILLAEGKVMLTVRNLTADIFKFRIGHAWWEEQNGLLQDQSGTMVVDTDEHHELHRYIWSNGVLSGYMRQDVYSFYVPRGITRHTVTFGGPQIGRVSNQCGVAIKATTSMMTAPVTILDQTSRDDIQCLTGEHLFIVYFGPDFKRFHQIPFKLNDKLADEQVRAEEIVNGQRIARVKRVDFVATILPSDLRTAKKVARYRPSPE